MSFNGVRLVALVEAGKGGLVLAVGVGLFALMHRDLQNLAEQLVAHFHLNPASRYPRIFLHAAGALTDARLWLLASGALAYSAARLVEAYGLWRERVWAEWFAVASGALYVPIELYELWQGVTWAKVCLLAVNSMIVAYLGSVLWRNNRRKNLPAAAFPLGESGERTGRAAAPIAAPGSPREPPSHGEI